MAGHLHLLDIGDWGPWQPDRIRYDEEEVLDSIAGRLIFTKAKTVEELDAALQSSSGRPGSVTVWISEDLLDAAKERWEEMHDRLLQDMLEH